MRVGESNAEPQRPNRAYHHSEGIDLAPVPHTKQRKGSTGICHSALLTGTPYRRHEACPSFCLPPASEPKECTNLIAEDLRPRRTVLVRGAITLQALSAIAPQHDLRQTTLMIVMHIFVSVDFYMHVLPVFALAFDLFSLEIRRTVRAPTGPEGYGLIAVRAVLGIGLGRGHEPVELAYHEEHCQGDDKEVNHRVDEDTVVDGRSARCLGGYQRSIRLSI